MKAVTFDSAVEIAMMYSEALISITSLTEEWCNPSKKTLEELRGICKTNFNVLVKKFAENEDEFDKIKNAVFARAVCDAIRNSKAKRTEAEEGGKE